MDDTPLRDEAKKRGEWRDDDAPKPSAPGHTLPASEDEDETSPDAPDNGDEGGTVPSWTIPPPD